MVITFDEGGGYYDSGFIQPLDYFGDGPRIPLIAVSPFSKGGQIVHSYTDHVSILKFIERNWRLAPLTGRSRDNLPNPRSAHDNPYVPLNMPAIGDLFDMFDFGSDDDRQGRGEGATNQRIIAAAGVSAPAPARASCRAAVDRSLGVLAARRASRRPAQTARR